MPKRLPKDHSIASMERLADALAADHAAEKRQARRRVEAAADALDGALGTPLAKEDAKRVVAWEHGFASWRQLAVFADHPAGHEDFLQLGCINYFTTDRPANYQRARTMLAEDASLGSRDIWHASCAGDAEAVGRFLAAEPELVNRLGGYFDWPPLLYACYSRIDAPGMSTLAVARRLLEHGADPNAHYMWGGQYRFTALTGAFGEGEMGPVNQPPHPHWQALARLLLDAGADCNDGQALYNTMFTPSSDCLEMLLQHGLNAGHKNNWLLEEGDQLIDNDNQTLGYQLEWAARNHHVERARLLIEKGADVNRRVDGRSLYEWAWLTGHPDLAQHLADHGAETVELNDVQRFAGLCMSGDGDAARALLRAQPELARQTQTSMPQLLPDAAASNRLDAARTMLDLGFDPALPDRTALHQAAFHGHADMAKLLIEKGANLSQRDAFFAATPMQWAVTAGQRELVAFLATQPIGIFDAALCENEERLATLLDANPALLETTIGRQRQGAGHDEDWQTPLAFAATRHRPRAVAFLLRRGARTDARDGKGRSLLEVARGRANADVVALLEASPRPASQLGRNP